MAVSKKAALIAGATAASVVLTMVAVLASHARKRPVTPAWAQVAPLPDSLDDGALAREVRRFSKELSRLTPRGAYVVIDTHANQLTLRTVDSLLFRATCSTGAGHELVDSLTNRRWVFRTPKGVFKINSKLTNPWWRKPDWAFVEENQAIPAREADRYDEAMLGDFAMGFGDGYFIHGTLYERLLGVSVTHGCVRLGADDLKHVYDRVKIGTPVFIF